MKANYLFFHMLSNSYQKFHSLFMKNASLHIYVLMSLYNIVSVCTYIICLVQRCTHYFFPRGFTSFRCNLINLYRKSLQKCHKIELNKEEKIHSIHFRGQGLFISPPRFSVLQKALCESKPAKNLCTSAHCGTPEFVRYYGVQRYFGSHLFDEIQTLPLNNER